MNEISIHVSGKKYTGWEDISVSRSISALCGSFSIKTVNRWTAAGQTWPIHEQDPVEVKIDDEIILSGYVDLTKPDADDGGMNIQIDGRDKTCDLVDCSAVNIPGSWKKTTLKNIVSDLIKPFGLDLDIDTSISSEQFSFELQNSETVFAAINRLCKKFNVLPISLSSGKVSIVNAGRDRADVVLEYGKNIKKVGGTFDFTDRFSDYIVRGQESGSGNNPWKNSVGKLGQTVKDSEVLRYRPLIVQAEASASNKTLKSRAEFELTERKAKGFAIDVVVSGWRQSRESGRLWQINERCKIKVPPFELDEDLLIDTVTFTKGTSGSVTSLKLIPLDSYMANPISKTKRKKGIAWT